MAVRLKRPWRDGTSHVAFTETEFIEKLVALIPRPGQTVLPVTGQFPQGLVLTRTLEDAGLDRIQAKHFGQGRTHRDDRPWAPIPNLLEEPSQTVHIVNAGVTLEW